jgi:DNA-binding CsgD family transcriptional regulator
MDAFLAAVARAAATAESLPAFRARALALVREVVAFDVGFFHALSPRVPLATGAFLGVDPAVLAGTMPAWDQLAVDLGRLRDFALAHDGVATDRDAFPPRSAARRRFEEVVARPLRVRAMVIAHLTVRGAVRSAVVLCRSAGPFSAADADRLRALVPILAVCDSAQVALDDAPRAALPTRLRCEDQRLTTRQREIVELVALGHTNDAIAATLGVSPNTLRNHLADVFRRLGASNRADAVRLAVLRT